MALDGSDGLKVICDLCRRDYTNSTESGGVIIGGIIHCPECAEKVVSKHHPHNILARCPDGLAFREWVYSLEYFTDQICDTHCAHHGPIAPAGYQHRRIRLHSTPKGQPISPLVYLDGPDDPNESEVILGLTAEEAQYLQMEIDKLLHEYSVARNYALTLFVILVLGCALLFSFWTDGLLIVKW
jgi:hypothetical protein